MPREQDDTTTVTPEEQARLDEEARKRQDVSQTPRMLAMAAIDEANEQRIREQLAAEGLSLEATAGEQGNRPAPTLAPPPPPEDTHTPAPPAPSPSPATAPGQAPSPAPASAARSLDAQLLAQLGTEAIPLEALDQVKVRVKIDGEEREMTLHDIRRSTQLDGAAARRLQQANELLERARAAQPPVGAPASPPVGVDGKPVKSDSPPASSTDDVGTLVKALFVGDEEAATAALQKVLAPQPAIDQSKLVAQVGQAVKQQLTVDEANAQFRSGFPEIVGDPHLARAADGFYEEVLAEAPHKTYAEALAEAGKRTRDWMASKGIKPATEPASGSTRKEKLERKEQIDEVRGLNRTATQQEEQIQTPSDVIAEMRKERGLA